MTVSFAMVPEVVAFAFVAGVNPLVGLYAAFASGLVTALWGGRPGMISGGAGSLAVVSAALVAAHGVEYLFAAVLLMGLLQLLVGALRAGRFIEMVPHPVLLGFVNGLAIVIFLAQLRQIPWGRPELGAVVGIVALTIAVIVLLPRLTRALPSALAAIGVSTAAAHLLHLPIRQVRDLAAIHGGFPSLHLPAVPLTLETLQIVAPYALLLAGVGLTESLLTQQLVDEVTQTPSSSDRECIGQGLGNLATGALGGMGGCAMIGQTMINLESGGRGRLSGVVEALSILACLVFASPLIGGVPIAALTGVMLVVVARTFAWSSLRQLGKIPRIDAFVLVMVSAVTVWRDLATGVLAGVVVSALAFAWQCGTRIGVRREEEAPGQVVYEVYGTLFFGSTRRFLGQFHPDIDPESATIDFSHAYLYGHSARAAVEALVRRYALQGKSLRLRHLSPECQALLARPAGAAEIDEGSRHVATERLRPHPPG